MSNQFPLSSALGLKFVVSSNGKGPEQPGYDSEAVKTALGVTRFNALMAIIVATSEVFSCNHAKYPANYADASRVSKEIHCIWARDLEAFLKAGH